MPFGPIKHLMKKQLPMHVGFKEADVDAIKLEGGRRVTSKIRAIADAGIVVFGHIGLTPHKVLDN